MSANWVRPGGDDRLEAELRNPPPCEVPAGLEESLLAEIPPRFGKPTVPSPRRRALLLVAAAACVPAAIGGSAFLLFESLHTSRPGRDVPGREPAPVGLNTHAEETRPCDVLPPLP